MKPFLQNITDKIAAFPKFDENAVSEIILIIQDGLNVYLIHNIFTMNEDIKLRIKRALPLIILTQIKLFMLSPKIQISL